MNEHDFIENIEKDKETGCWIWQRCKDERGYGMVKFNGVVERAHRVSFKLFVDSIGSDEIIMHICDNPPCINPDHLRKGTKRDNNKDRDEKGHQRNGRLERTHCPQGHPYDKDNTYFYPSGARKCRTCHRERENEAYYMRTRE